MNKELRVVGTSAAVTDAEKRVAGSLQYTADIYLPNMLFAKMIFSPHAHAKIKSIDTSLAEQLPGVKAIAHCFNTTDKLYNRSMKFFDTLPEDQLFTEQIFPRTVRHMGDKVCAVAAVTEKVAEEAIKLIKVEYEVLPHVLDIFEAMKPDAPKLYDFTSNDLGTIDYGGDTGNLEQGFSEADHIFEDTYTTPVVKQTPMETHAAIADFSQNGKATIYCSTQAAFSVRSLICYLFDLPMSHVRVIKPPLGGAFGVKIPVAIEPQLLVLSMMSGQPVKMVLTRKEQFLTTNSRHASWVRFKTGVKKDGTITASECELIVNTGAHASSGMSVAGAGGEKSWTMYEVPNIRCSAKAVMTNIISAGAMRGYGAPQYFVAQQLQMNKIAKELGIDLVELHLKNAIQPGSKLVEGKPLLKEAIEKGRDLFDWNNRKNETNGTKKRGFGMAVASHGNGIYQIHRDYTGASLTLNEDGTFRMMTGVHEMGTGIVRMQTMVMAEVLGVEYKDIAYYESDTDAVPWNVGDYASRGVFVPGNAAKKTAEKMKELLLETASSYLQRPLDNLTLGEGGTVIANDASVSFQELATYASKTLEKNLTATEFYANSATRWSYGVHFAEVEVDTETGEVTVLDYSAVHDVGQVMNRRQLEGQVHGGIQMGLGYALSEEVLFDEDGKMLTTNFKKYKLFHAKDMPEIKVDFVEGNDLPGPFGGKSIGECATDPVAPAVVNAVQNALGVEFHTIPLTKERILKALGKA